MKKFDGAFAENTLRAYRSDFGRFETWCQTFEVPLFEPNEADLAHYVDYLAIRYSSASVRRHIASISSILRLSGHQDTTKFPEVVLALKRMHRRKGRAQRQAIPLTRTVLERLMAACTNDPRGQRDRVLLQLGYDTMRRRAELCRLTLEDMVLLPSGKAGLRLNFSKTDQFGTGKIIPISQALHQDLRLWAEHVGDKGPILRSVHNSGTVGAGLHPASVNRILERLQRAARLDLGGRLTGHSFRVGAALDLLEAGESLEKIMLRGGWQAQSTVINYLRAWQAM